MSKEIEYKPGQVIGNCIYLGDAGYKLYKSGNRDRLGKFKCKCGNEFINSIQRVRIFDTKSCGCRFTTGNKIIEDPIYLMWHAMKNRCHNKSVDSYDAYGGRGIVVCEQWRKDFYSYKEYILNLSNARKKNYSLDRINNDGNYEPGNLRWASKHLQSCNRRLSNKNTSGFKGVYVKGNRFTAGIGINRKQYYLGIFDNVIDAINVRNNYIIKNGLWEYDIQLAEVV